MIAKTIAAVLLFLTTLAVAEVPELMTSPETFAVCKAVDIASTAYLLSQGGFVEANSIVAGSLAHGYFPLIAFSVGLYFLLKHLNDPVTTGVTNVVTCGVGVHNLLLIP
jgi:hypothetical protein